MSSGFFFSNSFLMLERSMNFQWTKQRATLDNIINAETPGYKAKYVTFEDAFRTQLLAAAAVAVLHLWKHNNLLSIFGGTVLYMVLVQAVF